jgi:hypothetical protein
MKKNIQDTLIKHIMRTMAISLVVAFLMTVVHIPVFGEGRVHQTRPAKYMFYFLMYLL